MQRAGDVFALMGGHDDEDDFGAPVVSEQTRRQRLAALDEDDFI